MLAEATSESPAQHPSALQPSISLIAAVARNGVIGRANQLIWRLPEDQQFFRRTTTGHPVVMGRKTWDSLPANRRPLPGRRNLVLTRQPQWAAPGAERATSLAQALQMARGAERVFVIGGAELYALAIAQADELLLTEIERDFDGDTHFPPLPQTFVETARQCQHAAAPNDFDFCFVTHAP